jgi:hypothetical protein
MQPTTTYHGKKDFNPLDYALIAVIDEWPPEHASMQDQELYVGSRFENPTPARHGSCLTQEGMDLIDSVQDKSRCDHCQKSRSAIRYIAYALHTVTNEVVLFGATCAEELHFGSEMALALHRAEKANQAAKEREAINAKRNEWNAANPEQAAALDAYEADIEAGGEHDEFLDSLSKGRRVYGALTEKQTPWPTKALAKRAEWAAKKAEQAAQMANAPALAEGRYEMEGIIRTIKWQDSDFGGQFKMLVELADGNRVWGTLPSKLEGVVEVGDTVMFTAQVERSKDDEHFGFYKRPTKVDYKEA